MERRMVIRKEEGLHGDNRRGKGEETDEEWRRIKERRMVALDRENRKGKEKGLQGDKTSKGEETDKKIGKKEKNKGKKDSMIGETGKDRRRSGKRKKRTVTGKREKGREGKEPEKGCRERMEGETFIGL